MHMRDHNGYADFGRMLQNEENCSGHMQISEGAICRFRKDAADFGRKIAHGKENCICEIIMAMQISEGCCRTKKQMKKEEQERLGEEGAAIAEAVALQVLIGEDLLDSSEHAVDKDDEFNSWYSAGRVDLLMGSSEFGSSSSQEVFMIEAFIGQAYKMLEKAFP